MSTAYIRVTLKADHILEEDESVIKVTFDYQDVDERITVWCKVQMEERTANFEVRGPRKDLETLIRLQMWERFQIEDSMYWVRSEDNRTQPTTMVPDRGNAIMVNRAKTQMVPDPTNLYLMTEILVQMDRESFQVNAPLGEQERRIRTILRERYDRPDSMYVLKIGACPCTPGQIEQGQRTVTVFSQMMGGCPPDPPEIPTGMKRTRYKLSDDSEHDLIGPETDTIEEVLSRIRDKHHLKGRPKVEAEGAVLDKSHDSVDWAGKTGDLWNIVEFLDPAGAPTLAPMLDSAPIEISASPPIPTEEETEDEEEEENENPVTPPEPVHTVDLANWSSGNRMKRLKKLPVQG